jgi:integrative and conjugative element protein (TIGR02256 family)
MRSRRAVKLSASLADDLIADADLHRPRETGGVLLGIAGRRKGEREITELIGAGPKAKRERHRFAPDGPWQRAAIAKSYSRSSRTLIYLGDWHSHPSGNGPSELDRKTAGRIAAAERARCPHPIFLIVTRSKGSWELRAYRYGRKRLRRIEVEVEE